MDAMYGKYITEYFYDNNQTDSENVTVEIVPSILFYYKIKTNS